MNRILIINIFGIGDVLFTTPLVRNIRESFPDAYIGYICNKRAQTVLQNNPRINKLFIYERDDYCALYKGSKIQFLKKFAAALREIKKENFDVVFDFSLNRFSSLLMCFLGIKKRIGFNYKNRSVFLNTKININGFEGKHVAEYYLSLLERLGLTVRSREMEVFLTSEDQSWAKEILNKSKINPKDLLIGILPGGGTSWGPDAQYKRWPAEHYAELGDRIVEKFSAKIVLLGDASEDELGRTVATKMRRTPVNLVGQTTVGQSLALLAKCNLVIVNDGGPLHMAVAAGAKTISLFGPVDENVYGPFPREGHSVVTKRIACRPCYRHFRRASCDHFSCIRQIGIEEVFQQVEKALE